jgi:hypothetical protein
VKFFMFLSGHRKPADAGGEDDYVDFYQRYFPEGVAVVPAL